MEKKDQHLKVTEHISDLIPFHDFMKTMEYTGLNRIAGQESVPDFKHFSQQVAPYSRIQVAEQFRNNEQQCSSRFEFIRGNQQIKTYSK